MSRLYNKGPRPHKKSIYGCKPRRIKPSDHTDTGGRPSKGPSGQFGRDDEALGWTSDCIDIASERRKKPQQMAGLFSGIKFNFGGKDKENIIRDITTGNNVRSGGGQRYTKPDTLYT